MTLTVFEDARGLWIADEDKERVVPFNNSSVEISVKDGSGCVLNGTLLINGTPFAVDRGRCKLLTEALSVVGYGDVVFVTDSGIKRSCSPIKQVLGKGWRFTDPHEALSDDDILRILSINERLREKLESAKALCSDTVSSVLGI